MTEAASAETQERSQVAAQQVPAGKDLYELGEIPPLGQVPPKMYAWVIRRARHGEPETAMQIEVVDTPAIDSHEVLVMVMAAGSTTTASGPHSASRSRCSTCTRPTTTSPARTPPASSGRSAPR